MVCGLKFDHDKLLKLHMQHYHKMGEKENKKDLLTFCQDLSLNLMKQPAGQEYAPWTNGNMSQGDDSNASDQFLMESNEKLEETNVFVREQDLKNRLPQNMPSTAGKYVGHDSSLKSEKKCDKEVRRCDEIGFIPLEERERKDERFARGRTWSSDVKRFTFTHGSEENEGMLNDCEDQGFYRSHSHAFLEDVEKKIDKEGSHIEPSSRSRDKREPEIHSVSYQGLDSQSFRIRSNGDKRKEECETQANLSRPSVITSNVSSFRKCPQRFEQQHQERESVIDSDRGSEVSESCFGTDDDTFDSSGESDSSSVGDNKQSIKRTVPRCNRCCQTFSSKMEYLHHLISHQRGNPMNVGHSQFDEQEKKHVKELMFELRGQSLYSPSQGCDHMSVALETPLSQLHNLSLVDRPQKSQNNPFGESGTPMTFGGHSSLTEKDLQFSNEIYPNHLSYGRVACSDCGEIFTDEFSCKIHIERKHFQLRCKECGLKFDHRKLLRIHIESYHSSKEMLKCLECGQSFDERSQFVSHVTLHQKEIRNRKDTSHNRSEEKPHCSPEPAQDLHQDADYERDHKPTMEELLEYSKRAQSGSADAPQSASQNYGANPVRQIPALTADFQRERHSNFDVKDSEGGIKTRIFIPKFESNQSLITDTDFNSLHSTWYTPTNGLGGAPLKKQLKRTRSAPPETSKRVSTIVSTTDCSSISTSDVIGTSSRDLIGSPYMMALQNSMLKRIKQEFDERSESILQGPPPLIPITRRQSQVEGDESKSQLQGDQFLTSPVRELDKPSQTVKPSVGQQRQKTKLARSFSAPNRDNRIRESIQTATKEALLHTLSLKRRVALLEQNNLLRKQQENAACKNSQDNGTVTCRENTAMDHSQALLDHSNGITKEKETNDLQRARLKILSKSFDCHHCGLHFDHKKLLKIHLDAYHGSNTRMSCDRCDMTFIDRDTFLNHLMSHPEDEQGFQPRYNRPYVRRKSKTLANGETIVSRELNPVMQYTDETEPTKKIETEAKDQLMTKTNVDPIQQGGLYHSSTETMVIPRLPSTADSIVLREYHVPGVVSNEQPFKKGKFKLNPEDQSNECFVCGKMFESGRRLEVHISSHASLDKDGRYCCSLCNKTFDHHRKLEIHTRSHTGFKPHKCDQCGRRFPYYSSFYYHKMTHTKDKPHKCPLCGKGFIQTRYLRTHLRTHKDWQGNSSGEDNVPSPSTPLSETYESTDSPGDSPPECVDHSERHDGSAFEPDESDLEQSTAEILCSFKANCRRRESLLASVSSPENHGLPSATQNYELSDVKQELGSKNVIDDGKDCQVQTRTPSEKPYRCKQCNKSFSAYSSLYVHNRIHTGQRPYSCKYCGKKFTHASGLKRHVRCHTGERPYPCPLCPSAFADRGALRSHIRTHTGERPYKCNWCGKTYTQPSSLKVHKRTLHVEEEMKAKTAKINSDKK